MSGANSMKYIFEFINTSIVSIDKALGGTCMAHLRMTYYSATARSRTYVRVPQSQPGRVSCFEGNTVPLPELHWEPTEIQV